MQTVIFGTGEIAEILVMYYIQENRFDELAGFIVDDEYFETDNFFGLKICKKSEILKTFPPNMYKILIALSYMRLNKIRMDRYLEIKKLGYNFTSFISKKNNISKFSKIGENCIILENQTVQPKVIIENNVMIWSGNHLGHGCVIKAHAYLSSHICISGFTEIGERTFVGVNSSFADYIKIGSDVFVTMGSNVTKNIKNGSVFLGNKSICLEEDDIIAQKIKKSYFKL